MKSKYKNWKTTLIMGCVIAFLGFALWSVSKGFSIVLMVLGIASIFAGVSGKKTI